MKIGEHWRWTSGLALAAILLSSGCESALKIEYQYDGFGLVEIASARSGESIVAAAKRVDIHPVGTAENGATVSEIEVEETHFAKGTQNVVYTGRMVFRCKTNQEFGERVTDKPLFGTRPRDVFRQWPYARIGMP